MRETGLSLLQNLRTSQILHRFPCSVELIMLRKSIGLIAAPFSPFRSDRSLNLDAVAPYAKWLSDQGILGAFICGTTGESASLTLEERKQLAERWVETAPDNLRVVVHVGHVCLADCQELARHAQSIGADSIAALSPYFFRPSGEESLVDWCEQVAKAAPELPFYYYHIPSMTGLNVQVSRFLELASGRIPNLAGVKFTHDDLDDLQACLQSSSGPWDMLFGRDELLLSVLQLGAQGAVGSTYNFAAPLFQRIIAAHAQGEEEVAAGLQRVATEIIERLATAGGSALANFKRYFSLLSGIDCGPVRLPLSEPTDEQFSAARQAVDQALHAVSL